MEHPFDRYSAFTDLTLLKEFSDRPLRKSIRVNTLKTTVEEVRAYGAKKGWKLEQVPWCPEGFYIDRPVDESGEREPLGKDLLQLLGHFYMQEAASMLPPAMLGAQPGETILDMSAAPGSKTTQIASALNGNGCILANDVQEKRLWTLKAATHRLGVHNVIVTKKVGQWFSKQMTERFDRVLCDAPCTAQGTARKDSDALNYCSLDNIGKMARLQRELIESAVDACKVGGTIVYSTCTLTPEENEAVVLHVLNRFAGQVESVDLREKGLDIGIADAEKVFASLDPDYTAKKPCAIRLWPQTYDTEGFFCAAFKKTAPTRHPQEWESEKFQEEELSRNRKEFIVKALNERYGCELFLDDDRLFQIGDRIVLSSEAVARFRMPISDYALGMPCAKRLQDDRLIIDHEFVTLRGAKATQNVLDLSDEQLTLVMDAKDAECSPDVRGHTILRYQGIPIGLGLCKEGKLKNNLPRWMVRF